MLYLTSPYRTINGLGIQYPPIYTNYQDKDQYPSTQYPRQIIGIISIVPGSWKLVILAPLNVIDSFTTKQSHVIGNYLVISTCLDLSRGGKYSGYFVSYPKSQERL